MIKLSSVRLKAALIAGSCVTALAAAAPAAAQDGNSVIGPPQLQDFQLEPRQRIVTQPRPDPTPPAQQQPTPAPAEGTPGPRLTPAPPPQQANRATAPAGRSPGPRPTAGAGSTSIEPQPVRPAAPTAGTTRTDSAILSTPADQTPAGAAPSAPVALPDPPAPAAPTASDLPDGPPTWLFFLAFATLGLLGYGFWLRRRGVERRALAGTAAARVLAPPAPAAPRPPRPAPQPRPWLELELTPERASIDVEESVIEFDLAVRNSGGTEARNVRLQARMIPSTPQQDKEIGDYFKASEAEYRTIQLPPVPAGEEIKIKGSVDIKRDRISALKIDGKLLFIPIIAVNARYGWGESRSGQTGRSWVIGREPAGGGDKMGPFRLDLGARVHRTVGRRPHPVNRRI